MKRALVVAVGLWLSSVSISAFAQNRVRFAGDPLLVGAGARSLALGGAYVALSEDATAVYWNAAGLARLERGEVQAQHTEQFGGIVNNDLLTFVLPTRAGGLGVGITRVSVDGVRITRLEDEGRPLGPDNRPEVASTAGTSDHVLYLGFGKTIRPRWSVGSTIKIVWRNLVVGSGSGFGFDAGLRFDVCHGDPTCREEVDARTTRPWREPPAAWRRGIYQSTRGRATLKRSPRVCRPRPRDDARRHPEHSGAGVDESE